MFITWSENSILNHLVQSFKHDLKHILFNVHKPLTKGTAHTEIMVDCLVAFFRWVRVIVNEYFQTLIIV